MHSSKEDVNWEIHMQAYYNIAKNDPSKLKSFVFTTASAKKFLKTDGTLYSVMDTMIERYIVNSGVLTQDLSKQVKGVVPNDLDVNFTCKDIPNAEAVLTNLSCSNAHFCKATESLDENEFENFMHTYFKKYVEVNESECLNRKLPKYENTKKENNKERRAVRRETEVVKEEEIGNCFRTAREEMWLQNSKKNDNKGSNLQQSSSSKRKLGMRGGVQRKFVSPVLSSNDMEQTAHKSEDNLSDFEMDERYRNIEPKMVELIKSEIMDNVISVTWSDIAGLEFAKTAIQEAIIWPMLRPDIFKGLRRPPKGILLFGPPGTGKTLIGKCVASQSKSTFFSISASSLTSKWIGDGEKMVRALFTVARCHQPAVIFIDEVDSLLSQRSDSEHESSRRIKTEFLVQLDGATTDSEERLLIIGATNRPQELDEAARRRFVKRLYIPLPEEEARYDLVKTLMQSERNCLSDKNFREIAQLSDGYSGADMRNLCSEASLGPIRSIDINLIERIDPSQVRPVEFNDFSKAFLRVRPSVAAKDLLQYVQWDQVYGSGNSF